MTRVYWDTMLFIYWLEDHPEFAPSVQRIYDRMMVRGDTLVTSVFTLGELLVGPTKQNAPDVADQIRGFFDSPELELLTFDALVAEHYAQIRGASQIKPADAIHLACAARYGVDLFLTNDRQLRELIVPGIGFIAGLDVNVL